MSFVTFPNIRVMLVEFGTDRVLQGLSDTSTVPSRAMRHVQCALKGYAIHPAYPQGLYEVRIVCPQELSCEVRPVCHQVL